MNLEELEEALTEIMPGFEIGTDNNGQIVIYTGMTEDEDGELLPMDEDGGDSAFDDETEQLEDDDPEDE
jgi:hypothetical protein